MERSDILHVDMHSEIMAKEKIIYFYVLLGMSSWSEWGGLLALMLQYREYLGTKLI